MVGIGVAVGFVGRSVQAVASLPETLLTVNRAARAVADAAESGQVTFEQVQRLSARLDSLVDELDGPLRALTPGLRRAAAVLDDPGVEQVPDMLRRVQADLLPIARGMQETQQRIAAIAASTERITLLVDEAGARLTTLPGTLLRWPFRGEPPSERDPSGPP